MGTWERLEKRLEKVTPLLLGLLLIYTFARSVAASTGKFYWYDELLTQLVTSQGSVSGIMAALRGPLDGQPPLFYVIEHLASRLIANQDIALRLPSAIGAVCTMFCVYVFLRRQSARFVALLCAAFLMMTALFKLYAAEARPYSLVVACIAFATICYTRAPSPKWVLLLAVSLAIAQSMHYLAVLSMVPFGLAELADVRQSKRIRWGVWLALAFGALPLFLFWNLLMLNKAYYGAHHVALGFKFSTVPQAYGDVLSVVSPLGMGMAMTAAIAMVIVWRKAPTLAAVAKEAEEKFASQRILIAGLLGLPFIAFFFVLVTHAPMASRYILPCVLGVALGFGYALARMPKQATLIFAVAVFSIVGVAELHFWRFISSERRGVANRSAATVKILEDAGYPELPVVVPNGYILWIAHYAFPSAPQRFVYLTKDPGGAGDTPDKSLAVAQRYVPVQVQAVSEFLSGNSRFLIYIDGDYAPDQWVTLQVIREGWSVQLLADDGPRVVYLVQKPQQGTGHNPAR